MSPEDRSKWERYRWCERKRRYESWDLAEVGAAETWSHATTVAHDAANQPLPYPCQFCSGYHIGHKLGLKPKPWLVRGSP
jgi:hypothetical protein